MHSAMALEVLPCVFALYLFICADASTARGNQYANMCGTPLAVCRREQGDRGSWSGAGHCDSDLNAGFGVHAVCIDLPGDFSATTGQSAWSEGRRGKPHCVCIGAWSMYINEGKDAQPNCNAIVKDVFSKTYIANWKTWNSWRKYSPEVVKGSLALAEKCEAQCADDLTLHQQWCCMIAGDADLKRATMEIDAGKQRWDQTCDAYQTNEQCAEIWAWEPSVVGRNGGGSGYSGTMANTNSNPRSSMPTNAAYSAMATLLSVVCVCIPVLESFLH